MNRIGNLRRPLLERNSIRRKQLDLDRLRLAGQIADHVLQHLDELHAHGRFLRVDLRTNILRHLVDAPAAILLELHQDIAAIRLCHRRQA